jgi:hypothetical protein
MLFFFRGKNGPAARAIIGALLVVVGIAVHGEALLIGIGAVLLVWAGVLALRAHRIGQENRAISGGRIS